MNFLYPLAITLVWFAAATMPAADEPAPGWEKSQWLRRDFMTDAFRQKPEQFYSVEYRWVAKPNGEFGIQLQKFLAQTALSYEPARAEKRIVGLRDSDKYRGKTYWIHLIVKVAIDRNSPSTDALVSKAALEQLADLLRHPLDALPDVPEIQGKQKLLAFYGVLSGEVPRMWDRRWMSPPLTPAYDQFPDQQHILNRVVEPVIRSWQANQGAPYTGSPNVVQSILVWYDYTEESQVKDTIAKLRSEYEADNAKIGKPIKILDVRTPIP